MLNQNQILNLKLYIFIPFKGKVILMSGMMEVDW